MPHTVPGQREGYYQSQTRQGTDLWLGRNTKEGAGCNTGTSKMTDTPPGGQSSWVDLTREFPNAYASPPVPSSPNRTTPIPFGLDQEYIKMLKEAQKEYSARSSARVSPLSSAIMSVSSTCKNTPSSSPKSPPNSPNVGLANFKDLKEQLKNQGVFINREPEPTMDDILCSTDWRSRPNMLPPRNWRLASSNNSSGSASVKNEGKNKDWNSEILLTILGTNTLSLAIGIGFGYWVYRVYRKTTS